MMFPCLRGLHVSFAVTASVSVLPVLLGRIAREWISRNPEKSETLLAAASAMADAESIGRIG
jgi:hypothetical protein